MTAPARAEARVPLPREHREPVLVLVGGVPGAGKSTLLARVADLPDVRVLDTEPYRRRIRAALPPWVPYRTYRAVVHGLHWARLLGAILRGPDAGPGGRHALLVHEPATRPARRERLARLAARYGWSPVLVMIDVDRDEALAGQRRRGRMVTSFEQHWERWSAQRPQLVAAAESGGALGAWREVHVAGRRQAPAVLRDLVGLRSP